MVVIVLYYFEVGRPRTSLKTMAFTNRHFLNILVDNNFRTSRDGGMMDIIMSGGGDS